MAIARNPLSRLRHDVRTPLNAIIGFSEVLLEELGPQSSEGVQMALRVIAACGHRLLTVVTHTFTEAEQQSPDQVPAWLPKRLIRVMSYDVELLRSQLSQLRQGEVAPEDIERLERAVETLATSCDQVVVSSDAPTGGPAGTAPERVARPSATTTTGGRVLVVDDLYENRMLVQRRLQLQGHQAEAAASGEEALEILARQAVDVVLLDVMMPVMDGLEVLRRIRENPLTRDIPVIMLSAMDTEQHVVKCIELGADDFVSKPFNPVFLRARVGACLEKKRLRDAEVQARVALETERARAESLLRVILPAEVVEELKATGEVHPKRYDHVAVLFCDVVNFTRWCDPQEPEEVVRRVRLLIERCEDISEAYGLQKIKTIGDSFMAVAGMLRPTNTPVLDCVRAGLEMTTVAVAGLDWQVRVGIHVGPVVAGVVGRSQYLFDLWGNTVNTAARIQSYGEPSGVSVSGDAWAEIAARCEGMALPTVEVKGKGPLARYQVLSVRPD